MKTDPDRCELLWFLRGEFDNALLKEMADVDYDDGWAFDWNEEILREILKLGVVPNPLETDPSAICQMLSKNRANITRSLAPEKRREQLKRLFACWMLLNAYAKPEGYKSGCAYDEEDIALWGLTECSIALGAECIQAAAQFVTWAYAEGKGIHNPSDNLYYLLSLFILRCGSPDKDDLAGTLAAYDTLVSEAQKAHPHERDDTYVATLPASALQTFHGLFGFHPGFDQGDSVPRWTDLAGWALDRLLSLHSGSTDPQFAQFRRRILQWQRDESQ